MKTQLLKGIALASLVTSNVQSSLRNRHRRALMSAEEWSERQRIRRRRGGREHFLYPGEGHLCGLGVADGRPRVPISPVESGRREQHYLPAVRGDYVVTPSNLKGTEPIYFVGAPPPESPRADAAVTNPTP